MKPIILLLLIGVTGWFIYQRFHRIIAAIRLGKSATLPPSNTRWKNLWLIAFGQKKMFQNPFMAILHVFVYVGFIVVNIEVVSMLIDGFFSTHHGLFSVLPFSLTTFVLNACDFLAVAIIVSCAVFLVRRLVGNVPRLHHSDLKNWPRLDGILILVFEITLMLSFVLMNAADKKMGDALYPMFFSHSNAITHWLPENITALALLYQISWWFHIIGVLGFAVYVTYSKHLHIFFAFPQTYFASDAREGKLENMPAITREVKTMLNLPVEETGAAAPSRFGVKDVHDMTWTTLLSAFSCTECGRCTAQCPANQTGKQLSPRKIMMSVRDRLEEVGTRIAQKQTPTDDGKSLSDYISKEELNACTTCQACIEACPVLIRPMDIIVEMRRYVAMEEAASPPSWNAMFQNIETNFAPWKFSPSDRDKWND